VKLVRGAESTVTGAQRPSDCRDSSQMCDVAGFLS
jgi:hypothetical protein